MISHSDNSADTTSSDEPVDNNIDFGGLLADARKTKNYTVDEVSRYLKIPVRTIVALEANDRETLPAPTYTQGYIRAYARFLEISEDGVLAVYSRAVPHDDVSDLKPRSNLPDEASSQSPLIKTITILLIVAIIAAIGFGGFQYYQKKAGALENELDERQQSFTGNSLNSPDPHRLDIKQSARLTDDGDLVVNRPGSFEGTADAVSGTEAAERDVSALAETVTDATEADETKAAAAQRKMSTGADDNGDTIEIFAENGSWVEVRDANKSRLLYNMLPVGGSRELVGQAPFSVTMGNAKTTRVVVNDIEVDVSDYIRSTNIASFKVSTQGQEVIFH